MATDNKKMVHTYEGCVGNQCPEIHKCDNLHTSKGKTELIAPCNIGEPTKKDDGKSLIDTAIIGQPVKTSVREYQSNHRVSIVTKKSNKRLCIKAYTGKKEKFVLIDLEDLMEFFQRKNWR